MAEFEAVRDGRLTRLTLAALAELGPALRQVRLATGLTQAALAERAGLTSDHVAAYEASDYRDAPLAHCQAVITALGVVVRIEALIAASAADAPPRPSLTPSATR